jgi:hypothetical protein
MPSKSTTILPVRVEHELIARLEALAERTPGATKTALARDALRLGLELLEADPGGQPLPEASSSAATVAISAALVPPSQGAAEVGLEMFAAQVLEAARSSKTGRFGDDRVFVSHVWRQFKKDHKKSGLDLETFKARLVDANRERHLSLVCADMAPFLPQKDVQESEIRYLSATFHLLCI